MTKYDRELLILLCQVVLNFVLEVLKKSGKSLEFYFTCTVLTLLVRSFSSAEILLFCLYSYPAITENFLGQSVTVCIEPVPESQPANKLQTMPLMNVSKTQDGKT